MLNIYSKLSSSIGIKRDINRIAVEDKPYNTGRYRVSNNVSSLGFKQLKLSAIKTIDVEPELLHKERVLLGSEGSAAAVAFKMLRTEVHQKMKRAGLYSLGVTSPNPSEGKSTTSINLAHFLATTVDEPVILVDFDMHRPSIAKKLSLKAGKGLIDYFGGNTSLEEVLLRVNGTKLLLLPNFSAIENATEMVTSDIARKLVSDINRTFPRSYIIYDLPPVLAVDDAILLTNIDANLVVAAEGKTTRRELKNTLGLLKEHNVIGHVLNKSKSNTHQQEYSAYYYY